MLRILAWALVVALLAPALPANAGTPGTADDVTSLADWILRTQLEDGAIAAHTDKKLIWPYLANFAAMGLAQTSAEAGDARYVAAAWRWLDWYARHQDASGFVTDYEVVDGTPVSTGDMDSTDAYAGTFLLAVEHVATTSGDAERLQELESAITAAVGAIEATQDEDGLTWAKPSWPVKYLMDQAETYAGLRSAARLAQLLDDPELAQRATRAADRLQSAVDGLYDRENGAYGWALHADGVLEPTRWDRLYPDALQQVWAVAFDLVPEDRARALMRRFLDYHPDWDDPTAIADIAGERRVTGYWPVVAWALSRTGMQGRASVGGHRILQAADAADRLWPFTPAEAGQLIMLRALNGASHLTVERVAGRDRVATAIAIATRSWDTAEHVVVAGAHRFPDALAAGGLATRLGAPLLLTPSGEIPTTLLAAIRDLGTEQVTLVGGTRSISASAADQLRATGLQVRRIAGADRYATSAAVALEVAATGVTEIVVASGQGFADALAAGALNLAAPVALLLSDDRLSVSVRQALEALRPSRSTMLGGSAVLHPAIANEVAELGVDVKRLAGASRYETATAAARDVLARRTGTDRFPVVVASGDGFADALGAAALVGRTGALLLLAPPDDLERAPDLGRMLTELRGRISTVTLVGGEAAVSERVRAQLQRALTPQEHDAEGEARRSASGGP